MDFLSDLEPVSDKTLISLGGMFVGLLFGAFAQRSGFCLRSATIEFWRGAPGGKIAIWLLAFSAALLGTQILIAGQGLDLDSVRQLATMGTLSGAIIGGSLFGFGMIMARGCASRLLVLSATGNLRALVAGLVLTVVAQASLLGALSPLRLQLSQLWLIAPSERNLANLLPEHAGIVLAIAGLGLALVAASRAGLGRAVCCFSLGVGLTVAFGWYMTSAVAAQSFDIIPVQSVSFTGPSADTLMALINTPDLSLSFNIGLVPGVFVGSLLAALLAGEFRVQGFDGEVSVLRYVIGAVLMGFGGMLAGGCAVGAGVTGGSVLALTAWTALLFMWLSAGVADFLLDRPNAAARQRCVPPHPHASHVRGASVSHH